MLPPAAGAAGAWEALLAAGGDALAEMLDSTEGIAVDAGEVKAAAAVHAQRCRRSPSPPSTLMFGASQSCGAFSDAKHSVVS